MKIIKKEQNTFVSQVSKGLIEMGATMTDEGFFFEFNLETSVGNLVISLRKEQSFLFMVFSRFDEIKKASKKFDCNKHSGKYNFSVSNDILSMDAIVNATLSHFEDTLTKEVA